MLQDCEARLESATRVVQAFHLLNMPSPKKAPLPTWIGGSPMVHNWREKATVCHVMESKSHDTPGCHSAQLRLQRVVTAEPDYWHSETPVCKMRTMGKNV